jgi:hypothetical protein
MFRKLIFSIAFSLLLCFNITANNSQKSNQFLFLVYQEHYFMPANSQIEFYSFIQSKSSVELHYYKLNDFKSYTEEHKYYIVSYATATLSRKLFEVTRGKLTQLPIAHEDTSDWADYSKTNYLVSASDDARYCRIIDGTDPLSIDNNSKFNNYLKGLFTKEHQNDDKVNKLFENDLYNYYGVVMQSNTMTGDYLFPIYPIMVYMDIAPVGRWLKSPLGNWITDAGCSILHRDGAMNNIVLYYLVYGKENEKLKAFSCYLDNSKISHDIYLFLAALNSESDWHVIDVIIQFSYDSPLTKEDKNMLFDYLVKRLQSNKENIKLENLSKEDSKKKIYEDLRLLIK